MIAWWFDNSWETPQGIGWDLFRVALGVALGVVCWAHLARRSWARRVFTMPDNPMTLFGCMVFGVVGPLMALISTANLLDRLW